MTLKESVEKIFKQNTNYADAQQLVNQAASLKYLSTDLYQDSKRFVYELLQNADDASVDNAKVKVAIRFFGDYLVVAHTGKAFDHRDIRGITAVDDGTKKNDPTKTGFKGIGFKSVFGQSDEVIIFSDGEYFRFDASFTHDWNPIWGKNKEEWESESGRNFEMPWQLIPILTAANDINADIALFLATGDWKVATLLRLKNIQNVSQGLKQLAGNVNMFLFLKNIETLEIYTEERTIIDIVEDEFLQTKIYINQIEKAHWLKHTITVEVPEETKQKLSSDRDVPEKLKLTEKIDLTFAAKLHENSIIGLEQSERLLYAYLPTEEKSYNIPVLVNTSFYTIANREALHKNSAWNQWIFENIPGLLLKWIAKLVNEKRFDAYNILPGKLSQNDQLAEAYNIEHSISIDTIPIVASKENRLLKVGEALVDFTFLSDKPFIGKNPIRNFMVDEKRLSPSESDPFVLNVGYGNKLKKAGVASFDWGKMPAMLNKKKYLEGQTSMHNLALIGHLKLVCENDKIPDVNDPALRDWSFVMDHNGVLRTPGAVFLPAAEETYEPDTDLSFIHPDLQKVLDQDNEVKRWLEGLGVAEKSDVTYVEKRIIPNAADYINAENAVSTVQKIYSLFDKGDIGKDILDKLRALRLMTSTGRLIPASECYFSDVYRPRLALEKVLTSDIFVSGDYLPTGENAGKWKMFLGLLGVREGIDILKFEKRLHKATLINFGIDEAFIDRPEHTHTWFNPYKSDEFKNIQTLTLTANLKNNVDFSKIFWRDVIAHQTLDALKSPATSYYGQNNKAGRINGSEVPNFISWFVQEVACLPTNLNICKKGKEIFLNDIENSKVAGPYLPIFDGPELSTNWRTFLGLKPRLELKDYLELLTLISQDPKADNKSRVQSIYSYLLDNFHSYDSQTRDTIGEWAKTAHLADSGGQYRIAGELKHYADGDPKVFGDSYQFIQLSAAIRKHPEVENLLESLDVEILRQSEFGIESTSDSSESLLRKKLERILPVWAKWMENEKRGGFEEMFHELGEIFKNLQFFEASELTITYGHHWQKKVDIHFVDDKLYLRRPWNSTKVFYVLPDKLCEIFNVRGYTNEIAFLLKASDEEIAEKFQEDGLELPRWGNEEQLPPHSIPTPPEEENQNFAPMPRSIIDYQKQWHQNALENEILVKSHGDDPEKLFMYGLQVQNDGKEPMVYHFSHLENAISIIRQKTIKSRATAKFLDSAGEGIISQTESDRKKFARFYFRSRTPTQYYVENLGRGQSSMANLKSDPLCPIPVFFIIPLHQAIKQGTWMVSLGTLASDQVPYGNDIETLKKFDFNGVYKNIADLGAERYKIAAHQEFLVDGGLDLSNIEVVLAVQDTNAKDSLIAMLGAELKEWQDKISIRPELYHNENPRIEVELTAKRLDVRLSRSHPGSFILQHLDTEHWLEMQGEVDIQYHAADWITSRSAAPISLTGEMAQIPYRLFYLYKGKSWLASTNTTNYSFDSNFIKFALERWAASSEPEIEQLFTTLKLHPELDYCFNQPIGGPDSLNLEQHTRDVIANYLGYFSGKQKFFPSEKEYLLCLALHDIGKPRAVSEGDRHQQHRITLEMLDRLKDILPMSEKIYQRMEILIDSDPIGKYLNPKTSLPVGECILQISALASKLEMSIADFMAGLVIYYQCDAAGYQSLRKSLFLPDKDGKLESSSYGSRLLFSENAERNFKLLAETIEMF
ncbi:DarT ssDNA thymidine ADP-ribosyltransferase family protein [Pedobacter agri]|uniref:DarT ssDNA thymidine ADP-ribosyltransferase family protein n=1 Tax=Pedobacter agri TaxID=454586 RepID=UPI00292FFDC2|nr:DarT ssDNA thymidine ADP-ribosyltransferase family protein [Pedobacter agri]